MFAPFLKIFDVIPGWAWAILLVSALGVAAVEREMHLNEKTAFSTFRATAAEKDTKLATLGREVVEAREALTAIRFKHSQEINDVVTHEKTVTAAALAAGATTRGMLVSATAALSASRGDGAIGDPKALKRAEDRAFAFGELLSVCDRVAESLGSQAEGLATQVRGLQAAYASLEVVQLGLLAGGPLANLYQIDPRQATLGRVVVDAFLPQTPVKPEVDAVPGLGRENLQVHLQGNPSLQHVLDNERVELVVGHL